MSVSRTAPAGRKPTQADALYIELDCPPGMPRPGDLFPGVIADTGLTEEDFFNPVRLFGNWMFVVLEDKTELYKEVRPTIQKRVEDLYNRGLIRYGSW